MSARKQVADLFCGAGGTSTGAIRALERLGLEFDLLAVNHWPTAVKTHELNHPEVRHLCADLNAIDPLRVSTKLDLLCASPECTHLSVARGGKPCDDQSRASAWHVLHWIDKCKPEAVFMENVSEWESWGPLNAKMRPIKSRKGELFRAFINAVAALGYNLDYKRVNAANFGDPTTRTRLIVMARRGHKKIVWPVESHSATGTGATARWRAAREVIDWSLKGTSLRQRKRPLKPNTMRRIMAGLEKFNGITPFLVSAGGPAVGAVPVSQPMNTVLCRDHMALVEPFIMHTTHHGKRRQHSVNDPMPTITGANRGELALVEPFLLQMDHTSSAPSGMVHAMEKPMPTVTTADAWALIEPFLVTAGGPTGQGRNPKSIHEPMPTLLTENRLALVEPFLIKYYGTANGAQSMDEPLDTITAKDRFMVVMPEFANPDHPDYLAVQLADGSKARLDVRFRMLQPHELSAAMGFPKDYQFHGNRGERVKQIGNAVCVGLADAHCGVALLDSPAVHGRAEYVKQAAFALDYAA